MSPLPFDEGVELGLGLGVGRDLGISNRAAANSRVSHSIDSSVRDIFAPSVMVARFNIPHIRIVNKDMIIPFMRLGNDVS